MVIAILNISNNFGIGKDGDLLFKIPKDLARFKRLTSHKWVVMGMNTFISIGLTPLPNRFNIVLTKDININIDKVLFINDIKILKETIKTISFVNDVFIIGGASIYEELLPLCDKIYLTVVEKDVAADVFFDKINYNDWHEIKCEKHHSVKYDCDYYFSDLIRIKNET